MLFTLRLIISFVAGGVFIALQTLIAERVHGKWRSIVLTVPSTLALGLFFVGFTKTPDDVVEAARIVPAALAPDYLFVAAFAMLSRFGFLLSVTGGFLAWAIPAYFLLQFPPETFASSAFLYGLPPIFIGYYFVKLLPQVSQLKTFPMTPTNIAIRSLIGGTIISLIVVLANTLGNIWGGLFSAFPAAFVSTFLIYYHLQGKAAIPAVARSLFFPGSIGFMVYAWIAALTFPVWGIWTGTLAAYLATFLFFWLYNRLYAIISP